MRLTRWDALVLARAVLVAGLALALAWLLTAATDEGGVSWGERAGRTLPLAPLCAAVGVWGAMAPVRARGDMRALEALGRTPAAIGAPAVAGGAALALAAALAVAWLPAVSVAGFYPTAKHASAWTWDGSAFVDALQQLRVEPDGTPSRLPSPDAPAAAARIVPYDRAAAAVATAVAGMATALLLADALLASGDELARGGVRERRRRRATVTAMAATGGAMATALVLFQAAAAHKVTAWTGDVPLAALLAFAARRYREHARP